MEEFISLIQFRTAAPFGYLIFFIVCLSVGIWAIKNIVRLCWLKDFKKPKLYVALGLLMLESAYIYINIANSEMINMNPVFSESDIVGNWVDGESTITLSQDGKATIQLGRKYLSRLQIDNGDGYWRKQQDFNIFIGSNTVDTVSKTGVLRVITCNNKYRIIIENHDPDMWDGDIGFKRKSM